MSVRGIKPSNLLVLEPPAEGNAPNALRWVSAEEKQWGVEATDAAGDHWLLVIPLEIARGFKEGL